MNRFPRCVRALPLKREYVKNVSALRAEDCGKVKKKEKTEEFFALGDFEGNENYKKDIT